MPEIRALLRGAQAVAFGWHGVLFDRDRAAIHAATRATLARWGVEVTDAELLETRGPTGRAHLRRLFALPRIAEAFRAANRHWLSPDDLDTMTRDLEPRLAEAAEAAREPNADACAALARLRAQGLRTAVISCTPRRLLGPQLAALERAGVPLDCVLTTDETCEPSPAPWGIYEAVQRLGLADPSLLVMVDDNPIGATAARNAGARAMALDVPGTTAGADARVMIGSLDELLPDAPASESAAATNPPR